MFFLNCHYSQSHSFLFKFSVISNLIVLFNRIYKINLSIYLISFSLNIIRFNRFVTLNLKKHRKTNNKNKILVIEKTIQTNQELSWLSPSHHLQFLSCQSYLQFLIRCWFFPFLEQVLPVNKISHCMLKLLH